MIVGAICGPGNIGPDVSAHFPVTHIVSVKSAERILRIFKVIVLRFHFTADTRVHTRLGESAVIVVVRMCGGVA